MDIVLGYYNRSAGKFQRKYTFCLYVGRYFPFYSTDRNIIDDDAEEEYELALSVSDGGMRLSIQTKFILA